MNITVDQAAEEFKKSIDAFVIAYKEKHVANPEQYPLSLPVSNAGLWTEFILDFHNNEIV